MIPPDLAFSWRWPSLSDVMLHVASEVISTFRQYRQTELQQERGGLLFVRTDDARGLVLARATGPHRADRATRYSLDLDPGRCSHDIKEANRKGLRLIGHWHTHAEAHPNPSTQDLDAFRDFGARYTDLLAWPLAVIVGTSLTDEGVRAWSIRAEGALAALRE